MAEDEVIAGEVESQQSDSGARVEAAAPVNAMDVGGSGENAPPSGTADDMSEASVGDDGVDALTPNSQEVEEARTAVRALLERAQIKRVVCVDDGFAGTVGDVLVACEVLEEEASKIAHLGGLAFDEPREVWEPEVKERWNALQLSERSICLADARQRMGVGDEDEQLNAGALGALLPEAVAFVPATPEDWDGGLATEVVAQAGELPTLVLFDRDMGQVDGVRLVADLFDKDSTQTLWSGLLTHTVTKEQEHEVWAELCREPGVYPDRFIVLSKQHLGPNPHTFPQSLKVTLMAPPASALRQRVADAINQAVGVALTELMRFSPQEFESVVFASSASEGVWEPDTLLRLYNVCIRNSVRTSLHASPEVARHTQTLRRLAEIPTAPTPTTIRSRDIHRREIYEDREHLNGVHLPVELGDVFTLPNSTEFVLVEQPCDLMVRGAGRRAPELVYVRLARLVDDGQGRSDVFELPVYREDGSSAWAHFGRTEIVAIQAVDYCVFGADGRSELDLDAEAPYGLWPAWTERHRRLVKDGRKTVTAVGDKTGADRMALVEARLRAGRTDSVKGEVDGNTIRYTLRRTNRLLSPYARALLTRYALHTARDAFDRPLT